MSSSTALSWLLFVLVLFRRLLGLKLLKSFRLKKPFLAVESVAKTDFLDATTSLPADSFEQGEVAASDISVTEAGTRSAQVEELEGD